MFDALLLLITLLFVKHFIIDFPLQYPYQWKNKGTYGHPGGLVHASLHSLGTFAILLFFTTGTMAVILAFVDGFIHYHVDYAKMNINKKMGWGPTTHAEFWTLVGLDQLLHAFTYIGIVYFLVH